MRNSTRESLLSAAVVAVQTRDSNRRNINLCRPYTAVSTLPAAAAAAAAALYVGDVLLKPLAPVSRISVSVNQNSLTRSRGVRWILDIYANQRLYDPTAVLLCAMFLGPQPCTH